jgi:hypothetical protein
MSTLNWAVGEAIASKPGATPTAAFLIVEHQQRNNDTTCDLYKPLPLNSYSMF